MSQQHPTTDQPAPYGGYHLTNIREAGGEETARFDAILRHHGVPIAHVSNGGHGGSHRYQSAVAGGWDEHQRAMAQFRDYAQDWRLDSPYSGLCDDDGLVDRLLEVARFSRMRRTPIALDGVDPWESGEFHVAPATMARDDVLTMLRSPQFASRSPRIWDKGAGDFVPVT